MTSLPANLTTKRHYPILDGLRGVAALIVVVFHLLATYSDNNRFKQIINHGYLAVDFFFLLSGFVIAYAYDDRWGSMSTWKFVKRRLIRLQPMIIAGSVLGAALFYFGRGPVFPFIAGTPVWKLLLLMLASCLLLPLRASLDIRGWGEMYPLNVPIWSIFFEYVANLLYAVGLRKLSVRGLSLLVLCAAGFLLQYLMLCGRGDVIVGWRLEIPQLYGGFARLLFPFCAGMLLMRAGLRLEIPGAFAVASALLVAALAMPRIGGVNHLWANGLYEFTIITLLFPLIITIGVGGKLHEGISLRLCRVLGRVSYPLYAAHYPFVYLYYAWVVPNRIPAGPGAAVGALLFIAIVAIAYALLKFYDEPVRAWLTSRLIP